MCQRRHILAFEDPIGRLDEWSDQEQLLKDRLHERLSAACMLQIETECWLYLGKRSRDGQVRIRVGQNVYKLPRIAAWIYIEGFRLYDQRVAVHVCPNLHCFNPEHLELLQSYAEAKRLWHRLAKDGHRVRLTGAYDDDCERPSRTATVVRRAG